MNNFSMWMFAIAGSLAYSSYRRGDYGKKQVYVSKSDNGIDYTIDDKKYSDYRRHTVVKGPFCDELILHKSIDDPNIVIRSIKPFHIIPKSVNL